MPSPKTIALISPYPGTFPELPDRLLSYPLVTYGPDQVDTVQHNAQAILLHLNGNMAEGPALIQALKYQSPRTPVLIIAENPSPEQVIEAYECGADAYILLPLDLAAVRRKLNQHLSRMDRLSKWWSTWLAWLWPWHRPRRQAALAAVEMSSLPKRADMDVRFFGSFELRLRGGEPVSIRSRRVRQLLACLLFHRAKGVSAARLMDFLWPDIPADSSRNSLNVALSQLRGFLAERMPCEECILLVRDKYILAPDLTVTTDLDRFYHYRQQGKRHGQLGDADRQAACYRQALNWYRGDFLEEFQHLEWTATLRDTLWETRLLLLEKLSEYYFDHQAYDQAVAIAKQLLEQDPCLEKVHRQLMLSYYHKGDRSRALQQFSKCEEVLREELNASPSTLTREVSDRIRRE